HSPSVSCRPKPPQGERCHPGTLTAMQSYGQAALSCERTYAICRCPGVQGTRVSDRADLLRLRALGALGNGVLDPLVVLEAAVAVSRDGGVVAEDCRRAVVRGDDPVALVRVEPLHCSLSHCALLARRSSACTARIPGCGDRLSFRGRARKRRRPRSELRGRYDTDTHFDNNQLHLTPCGGPAAL